MHLFFLLKCKASSNITAIFGKTTKTAFRFLTLLSKFLVKPCPTLPVQGCGPGNANTKGLSKYFD